ncbi:hypothetical protein EJB05_54653, partial [Eragrostis curvula]
MEGASSPTRNLSTTAAMELLKQGQYQEVQNPESLESPTAPVFILYLYSLKILVMERPQIGVQPRVKAYSCLVLRKMMEADQASSSSGSKKRTWGDEYTYSIELGKFIKDNFGGNSHEGESSATGDPHKITHPASKSTIPKENISRVGAVTRNATKRSSDRIQLKSSIGYESADEGYVLRKKPCEASFDNNLANYESLVLQLELNRHLLILVLTLIRCPSLHNHNNQAVSGVEAQIVDEGVNNFGNLSGTPVSAERNIEEKSWVTPHQWLKRSTVSPGSMSKLLACAEVMDRIMKSEDEVNVNVKPFADDVTESAVKQEVGLVRLAKSPWFYCLKYDVCTEAEAELVKKELMAASMADLQRQQCKLEDSMYKDCNERRWCHILETDFSVLSQADENPGFMKSIREHFFGPNIKYQINRCRMIVIPAQVLGWCCYFWDFKKKVVHIIDPTYVEMDEFYQQKHTGIVKKIGDDLAKCIEMFFDKWEVNWTEWRNEYVDPPLKPTCSHESGIMSLLCMLEFDGEGFRKANNVMSHMKASRKSLLAELLSIESNQATPVKKKKFSSEKVVYEIDYKVSILISFFSFPAEGS